MSTVETRARTVIWVGILFVLAAVGGCKAQRIESMPFPIVERESTASVPSGSATATEDGASRQGTKIRPTPGVDGGRQSVNVDLGVAAPALSGPAIQVSYNGVPIAAFIHEVFGTQLNLSYTLDPALSEMRDLVTLRLAAPVLPQDLYRIARSTLRTYGVLIRQNDEVLTFAISRDNENGETPLLLSGRALPEIPDAMRPIFMFVPLKVVSSNEIRGWLNEVLGRESLTVTSDALRNAVVLQGREPVIRQALAIIESLDQPLLRGHHSLSIEPAFVKVEDLAADLSDILLAEGYDVSIGPPQGGIVLLPLKASNALVVFATSRESLEHVKEWASAIDREQQLAVDKGIFSYEAQSARADYIVDMLNQLDAENVDAEAAGDGGTVGPARAMGRQGRFVVDANRNAILFRGSGQEWLNIRPVMERMDQAAPSVLVEVLIAEVTLNDQEATGIEWLTNGSIDIDGRRFASTVGTRGTLSLGASGLNMTLDRAGETRAVLNAFYRNERAEVRSRPRLMVKSGQSATIDIGNEIPVITSSTQSVTSPGAPVVQSVQYRKTGLTLTITPIVHVSGTVDIEIDQSLSESRLNDTSGIDSPAIFNRNIRTSVSLRDGGSVLLGGLVSSSSGKTVNGIPIIEKIPGLGRLFRTDSSTGDRTELMILLVPHVIRDSSEGEAIRELMRPPLLNP